MGLTEWLLSRFKRHGQRRQRCGNDITDQAVVAAVGHLQDEATSSTHRGSVVGRHSIPRNFVLAHDKIYREYFAPEPIFPDRKFRRRFRMRRALFERIASKLCEHDRYFVRRPDATGKPGCSTIQKLTACIRILAYGSIADSLDTEVGMAESTILESFHRFTRAVVQVFRGQYLRRPTRDDVEKLYAKAESRGFPDMLGSIDCMHWGWDMCPTGWQGMFRGHEHKPTVILEAVAGPNLWIWHAFFGLLGSLNDINVLHRSPVFDQISDGTAPNVPYIVNGRVYTMGYYLADGIYPNWATLVKAIPVPMGDKQCHFSKMQSAHRKDVEWAFGVLQAKWTILSRPARYWKVEELKNVVDCCIILHNMTLEDDLRQKQSVDQNYDEAWVPPLIQEREDPDIAELLAIHSRIRSRPVNEQLLADLVEHVWAHSRSKNAISEASTDYSSE